MGIFGDDQGFFETNSHYFARKLWEDSSAGRLEKFMNEGRPSFLPPIRFSPGPIYNPPPPPTDEQWKSICERTRNLTYAELKDIFESCIKGKGQSKCPHLGTTTEWFIIIPYDTGYCNKMETSYSSMNDCESNTASEDEFFGDLLNPYFPRYSKSTLIDRLKEEKLIEVWKCGRIHW